MGLQSVSDLRFCRDLEKSSAVSAMMDRGRMRVRRRESLMSDGGRGGAIGIAARVAFAFLAAGACGLAGRVGRRTDGSSTMGERAGGSGSIGVATSVDSASVADSGSAGGSSSIRIGRSGSV